MKNCLKKKYLIIIKKKKLFKILVYLIILSSIFINPKTYKNNHFQKKKIKIGIVGVRHGENIGNNLIKYAMTLVFKKFGFIPYIIGTRKENVNISFIKRKTNLVVIKKNFSEIKKNDYDILMINSDQTWRKFDQHFYDYGFLNFAKNWDTKKFVYSASGIEYLNLTQKEIKKLKILLKNFTGISVREKGSVKLVKKYFNIIPEVTLDPTLLIDKKYYLDLIKDYEIIKNNNYIFIYTFNGNKKPLSLKRFINKASKILNYSIYEYPFNNNSSIENFIYKISNSKAVITTTFHGTIFSIIFNKPFITFTFNNKGKERFNSLGKLLSTENRFFNLKDNHDINLLTTPLNINYSLLKELRNKSIHFIKKSIGIL